MPLSPWSTLINASLLPLPFLNWRFVALLVWPPSANLYDSLPFLPLLTVPRVANTILDMCMRRFPLHLIQTLDTWAPVCLWLDLCMWLALGPSLQLRRVWRLLVHLMVAASTQLQQQYWVLLIVDTSHGSWCPLLTSLQLILMNPTVTCQPCIFWLWWPLMWTQVQPWAPFLWTLCYTGILQQPLSFTPMLPSIMQLGCERRVWLPSLRDMQYPGISQQLWLFCTPRQLLVVQFQPCLVCRESSLAPVHAPWPHMVSRAALLRAACMSPHRQPPSSSASPVPIMQHHSHMIWDHIP